MRKTSRIVPFVKLPPQEKEKALLKCFLDEADILQCLEGEKACYIQVKQNLFEIPDMVLDSNVNMKVVKKYFDSSAWQKVEELLEEKTNMKMTCPRCSCCIDDESDLSVLCEKVRN